MSGWIPSSVIAKQTYIYTGKAGFPQLRYSLEIQAEKFTQRATKFEVFVSNNQLPDTESAQF